MVKKRANPLSVKLANTITGYGEFNLLKWGFHNIEKIEHRGNPAVQFKVRSFNLKGRIIISILADNLFNLQGYDDNDDTLIYIIPNVTYETLFESIDYMARTGGLTEGELCEKIFYIDTE